MGVRVFVAASVLLCAAGSSAAAQSAVSPPIRVELHGRMHFQWNSTSVGADETVLGAAIAPSTFEHRRVRLSADVQVSDWIRGRVEPELSMGGNIRLRNAWVALVLDPSLTVRAGQFKKPFNAIFATSGSEVPAIERAVRIRGLETALRKATPEGVLRDFRGVPLVGESEALLETQQYTGYDMGVAVEARRGAVALTAGVFNGNGPDTRDDNAGVSAAARATWSADPGVPLVLGGAWSRRVVNWPLPQSLDTRSGDAFVADVQLGGYRRGLWLLAEAATGDNLASEERFVGAHAMLALFNAVEGRRIEGWEPVARVSWGDPDRTVTGDEGVLVTPGLNIYFPGRNRLMVNWDVYMPRGDGLRTQHAARAQINLEF